MALTRNISFHLFSSCVTRESGLAGRHAFENPLGFFVHIVVIIGRAMTKGPRDDRGQPDSLH